MNKEQLKTKIEDLLDYYFPEIDNEEIPALLIILDALRELRNDIIDSHLELFDDKDPHLYDLSLPKFK